MFAVSSCFTIASFLVSHAMSLQAILNSVGILLNAVVRPSKTQERTH